MAWRKINISCPYAKLKLPKKEFLNIMYLARKPRVNVYLKSCGICIVEIAPYFSRAEALFFSHIVCHKGDDSAKHANKSK